MMSSSSSADGAADGAAGSGSGDAQQQQELLGARPLLSSASLECSEMTSSSSSFSRDKLKSFQRRNQKDDEHDKYDDEHDDEHDDVVVDAMKITTNILELSSFPPTDDINNHNNDNNNDHNNNNTDAEEEYETSILMGEEDQDIFGLIQGTNHLNKNSSMTMMTMTTSSPIATAAAGRTTTSTTTPRAAPAADDFVTPHKHHHQQQQQQQYEAENNADLPTMTTLLADAAAASMLASSTTATTATTGTAGTVEQQPELSLLHPFSFPSSSLSTTTPPTSSSRRSTTSATTPAPTTTTIHSFGPQHTSSSFELLEEPLSSSTPLSSLPHGILFGTDSSVTNVNIVDNGGGDEHSIGASTSSSSTRRRLSRPLSSISSFKTNNNNSNNNNMPILSFLTTTNSSTTPTTTTTPTTASLSLLRTRRSTLNPRMSLSNNATTNEQPIHQTQGATTTMTTPTTTASSSSTGIRSSLDSGMASVRRWLRARQFRTTTSIGGGGGGSRSSRAARNTMRREFNIINDNDDDIDNIDDEEQDLFLWSPRNVRDYPLSIVEEDDLFGTTTATMTRQRALSEPNGLRMRNFVFQRATQQQQQQGNHHPITTTTSRSSSQNRRRSWSARARYHSEDGDSTSSLRGSRARYYSDDDDGGSSRAGSIRTTSMRWSDDGSIHSAPPLTLSEPTHLSSAALNSSFFHSPRSVEEEAAVAAEEEDVSSLAETSIVPTVVVAPGGEGDGTTMVAGEERPTSPSAAAAAALMAEDPNREARTRWIRINRRFQLIITVVALIFSLLLFAILVCWVVLTSAYVVSIDKKCDIPLKEYFWLATLQLILDVFRTDIMRFIFRWDTQSSERIPVRVITYNIAYLIYAVLVLRLGIRSVFMTDDSTCPSTAPELYQSSAVFVSLSLAAWGTIVLGYLVPFCFVATLLTWNGYTPSADTNPQEADAPGTFVGGVFPAAYGTSGAPPGCVDRLHTVLLEEFPNDYPHECCICMGDFCTGEVIVATQCQHVFHKRCCEEWLRQARTCPVCRMDIPTSLNLTDDGQVTGAQPPASRLTRPFPGREDFHQDVVGLLQILRRQEERLRQRAASPDHSAGEGTPADEAGLNPTLAQSLSVHAETELISLEEGRSTARQHSR